MKPRTLQVGIGLNVLDACFKIYTESVMPLLISQSIMAHTFKAFRGGGPRAHRLNESVYVYQTTRAEPKGPARGRTHIIGSAPPPPPHRSLRPAPDLVEVTPAKPTGPSYNVLITRLGPLTCAPRVKNKGKVGCWLPLLTAIQPRVRAIGEQPRELGLLLQVEVAPL